MKTHSQIGFSLIELMIVVTIVGILAVVAIPSYKNYVQRARFAEVIAATAPFKTAVTLALQQGTPSSEIRNGAHGIPAEPAATKNLASLKVKNSVITATATPLVGSKTYVLKPNTDGSVWTVGGTCITAELCEP